MFKPTLLFFAFLFTAQLAWAEDDSDPGTLSSTDNFVDNSSQGALYNHKESDRLYRESREHEHEYRHHHEDRGLFTKAFNEARQAFIAETQAKQLASTALTGMQSASQQQNQTTSNESQVDKSALEEIANEQSALAQEMSDVFSGYGYNLNDSSNIAVDPAATSTVSTAATAPTDSRTPAYASPASIQGSATGATTGGQVDGFPSLSSTASALNAKPVATSSIPNMDPSAILEVGGSGTKGPLDKQTILKNRARVLAQMAKKIQNPDGSVDVIRAASDDIFGTVHAHYEGLYSTGLFFGDHLPPSNDALQAAALARDSAKLNNHQAFVSIQLPKPKPRILPFAKTAAPRKVASDSGFGQ